MRHLIIYIILLLFSIPVKAQTTFFLAVGINDYNDPVVNDLQCCENDVQSMSALMKKQGAMVVQCLGKTATKQSVLAALKVFCEDAKPNDAVIFFFSGHGYPGGFCPVDMTQKTNGLTYEEIQGVFKRSKAKRKMVFADACFSGGLRKNNSTANNEAKNGEVMFFLSSRSNELSQEVINGRNGQFTKFLVRALGGGADYNRDRIISAKELFNFVSDGVSAATGNKQHPVMWGKFDDNMVVTDWRK